MTPDEAFLHVRILVGIITGLSISRLLTGLARPIQNQEWKSAGLVHTEWAIFLLLTIVQFWWFQFGLSKIDKWTFGLYLFVIGYAILLFLACTILFPDVVDQETGRETYLLSRRKWFYGLLAAIFLVDLGDTAFKGMEYFRSLGFEYPIRQFLFATLSIVAIFVRWKPYHVAFVTGGILYQLSWAARQFDF